MKQILVVYFSQSGQMLEMLESFLRPLSRNPQVEIHWEELKPVKPYPFPWSFHDLFKVFSQSVLMIPPAIKPCTFHPDGKYDLVILAYTVWYLSPSLPVLAFLRSPQAEVMKHAPVITIVNARDKWLMAQEKVKGELRRIGAGLVDHRAFIHQGNAFQHLITTLRWLLTGKKNAFWGLFPPAGVAKQEIQDASRFGHGLQQALESGRLLSGDPIFQEIEALKIDPENIVQERLAYPNFVFWAKIIRAVEGCGILLKTALWLFFFLYLAGMVLLAVPVILISRILFATVMKAKMEQLIKYYEQQSFSPQDNNDHLET